MRAAPTLVPVLPAGGAAAPYVAGDIPHARVARESSASFPPSFPESGLGEIENHRRPR